VHSQTRCGNSAQCGLCGRPLWAAFAPYCMHTPQQGSPCSAQSPTHHTNVFLSWAVDCGADMDLAPSCMQCAQQRERQCPSGLSCQPLYRNSDHPANGPVSTQPAISPPSVAVVPSLPPPPKSVMIGLPSNHVAQVSPCITLGHLFCPVPIWNCDTL
jgi:hypothetical protein